ncbi:hypothetical protein V8F06_006412 [Rhypophila decipiens]
MPGQVSLYLLYNVPPILFRRICLLSAVLLCAALLVSSHLHLSKCSASCCITKPARPGLFSPETCEQQACGRRTDPVYIQQSNMRLSKIPRRPEKCMAIFTSITMLCYENEGPYHLIYKEKGNLG